MTIFSDLGDHGHFRYMVNFLDPYRVRSLNLGSLHIPPLSMECSNEHGKLNALMENNTQAYLLEAYEGLLRY